MRAAASSISHQVVEMPCKVVRKVLCKVGRLELALVKVRSGRVRPGGVRCSNTADHYGSTLEIKIN